MLRRIAFAVPLVSFLGCGSTGSDPAKVEVTVAPVVTSFTPSVTSVVSGSPTSVTWSWTYGRTPSPVPTCTVDQGVGVVTSGGVTTVTLTADTTFTLTCTSAAGTGTATARVVVTTTAVPPRLGGFSTSPASITAGVASSVTFAWSFTNAPSPTPTCTIDRGIGAIENGSSRTLTLDNDARFTLTCVSAAGASTATTTQRVTPAPVPPRPVDFAVGPGSVVAGIATSVAFTWRYQGTPTSTPTCTINNGIGAATSGATSTVTVSAPVTYSLTCTSAEGTGTATATLDVRPQVAPAIASLTASPDLVLTGVPTHVTWTWTYTTPPEPAPACTINNGVETIESGGGSTVTLTADTTFTLSCVSAAGTRTATKIIKVSAAAVAPVIASFVAQPATVVQGERTDVRFGWTYANAPVPLPSCTIDPGVGVPHGVASLALYGNTTFTITCTNSAGPGTASKLVTVIPATPPGLFPIFSATPSYVERGVPQTITFDWSYVNTPWPTPKCIIDHGVGPVSPGDQRTVTLPADTGFMLTCANGGGVATAMSWVWTYPRAVAVAAGEQHACAVLSSGAVWCWGYGGHGALGNGTFTDRYAPTPVSNLDDAVAVTVGWDHSCALRKSGAVVCWGAGFEGQVGTGNTSSQATPVTVGLPSPAVSIAAGGNHTCAVLGDGATYCWGNNGRGQIGDGTTKSALSPTRVATGLAVSVAASGSASCAVLENGGAQCWGSNPAGRLGDGTTTDRHVPVSVAGLRARVVELALGHSHTCARLADASVQCWGYGVYGQLGNPGAGPGSLTPTDVPGIHDAASVRAAGHFTCIRRAGGAVMCFGSDEYGQLGDGGYGRQRSPVAADLPPSVDISLANNSACAVLDTGHVQCWGRNDSGQRGVGTLPVEHSPVAVAGLPGPALGISAGVSFTCASFANGINCWGGEPAGRLGVNTEVTMSAPVAVVNPPAVVTEIHAGNGTCARDGTDDLWCWGGYSDYWVPSRFLSGVTSFDVGGIFGCVVSGGAARCFGENTYGNLGDGTTKSSFGYDPAAGRNRYLAVDVQGLGSGVVSVAAGDIHACAALAAGGVKCWGHGLYGQLGDGAGATSSTPVDVAGLTEVVRSLALGGLHSCALTESGAVKCWGSGIAFGGSGETLTPMDIPGLGSGVSSLAAGFYATCALMQNGDLLCWGNNGDGRAGLGSITGTAMPTQVALPAPVAAVSLGNEHGCAVLQSGEVYCFGSDRSAQVTGVFVRTPQSVVGIGP